MGEDNDDEGNKENTTYLFIFTLSLSISLCHPFSRNVLRDNNREVRVRVYERG